MKHSPEVRQLPTNTNGHDYVIGDLHGCYELLEHLMNEIAFDKTRDRLFSVGDLIDRGPDSMRCLALLAEPWFYAVKGNHEQMMLDFFMPYLINGRLDSLDDIHKTGFMENGGHWVEQHFLPDRHCMSDIFNQSLARLLDVPLVWVVGDGNTRFHVIHAELFKPDYFETSQPITWLDTDIDQWLEQGAIAWDIQERLLWGRKLMNSRLLDYDWARVQPGLSITFCGHTYADQPRQVLSHLCLDTGASISLMHRDQPENYGLTIYEVQTARAISASYEKSEVTES
jgi:serine/threonine protein phosphatase 1